jgi:hypothetical protein
MSATAPVNGFQYEPHPRIEQRKLAPPPKVHHIRDDLNPVQHFNAKFGLRITVIVGTMWCAYIFTTLAIVSLPSAINSGSSLIIVAWIAQTFLQLVLLPIIIVGQNQQALAADKRAEQTYADAEAILHECQQLQAHLQAQDDRLAQILASAERLNAGRAGQV